MCIGKRLAFEIDSVSSTYTTDTPYTGLLHVINES